MPAFYWLDRPADASEIEAKMRALNLVTFKVDGKPPYSDADIAGARKALEGKTELDALVAYLQGMGTAIKTAR